MSIPWAFLSLALAVSITALAFSAAVMIVPGRGCGTIKPIREVSSIQEGDSLECVIFKNRKQFRAALENLEMERSAMATLIYAQICNVRICCS